MERKQLAWKLQSVALTVISLNLPIFASIQPVSPWLRIKNRRESQRYHIRRWIYPQHNHYLSNLNLQDLCAIPGESRVVPDTLTLS